MGASARLFAPTCKKRADGRPPICRIHYRYLQATQLVMARCLQSISSVQIPVTKWKTAVVALLADKLGAFAELAVDDALNNMGLTDGLLPPQKFRGFVDALYDALPADIDRKSLCHDVRRLLLERYGV